MAFPPPLTSGLSESRVGLRPFPPDPNEWREVEMGDLGIADSHSRSESSSPVASLVIPAPAHAQVADSASSHRARNTRWTGLLTPSQRAGGVIKPLLILWMSMSAGLHFMAPMRSCAVQNEYDDAEPYAKLGSNIYGNGAWVTGFEQARTYLEQSPKAQALFTRLSASSGRIYLRHAVNMHEALHQITLVGTKRTVIDLPPNERLEFLTNNGRTSKDVACSTNSASVNLAHELAHAEWLHANPIGEELLRALSDPFYDFMNEYRATREGNGIAKELGEALRCTHRGNLVPATNVTDTNGNRCTVLSTEQGDGAIAPYTATQLSERLRFHKVMLRALPFVSPSIVLRSMRIFAQHDALVKEIGERDVSDPHADELKARWEAHREAAVEVASSFKRLQDRTAACPIPTRLRIRA